MTMTKFSRINKQREEITMRVLEDMEKGGNEWKKPWVEASPLPPHNPVSGTQYSGRNFLYTYVYGMMRGYADPRWATEKQIKEMGWKVPENLQNGRGGIKTASFMSMFVPTRRTRRLSWRISSFRSSPSHSSRRSSSSLTTSSRYSSR